MADPRKFSVDKGADDVTDFKGPSTRGQVVGVRVLNRAPAAKELGEGEHVFAVVGGVRKMYAKVQGVVVSTTLT